MLTEFMGFSSQRRRDDIVSFSERIADAAANLMPDESVQHLISSKQEVCQVFCSAFRSAYTHDRQRSHIFQTYGVKSKFTSTLENVPTFHLAAQAKSLKSVFRRW